MYLFLLKVKKYTNIPFILFYLYILQKSQVKKLTFNRTNYRGVILPLSKKNKNMFKYLLMKYDLNIYIVNDFSQKILIHN